MKNLARDYDDGMMEMKSKKRRMKPSEPGDPSMDLVTPDMLPDKPVIPPGREMGGGIKRKPVAARSTPVEPKLALLRHVQMVAPNAVRPRASLYDAIPRNGCNGS